MKGAWYKKQSEKSRWKKASLKIDWKGKTATSKQMNIEVNQISKKKTHNLHNKKVMYN